MLSNSIIEKSIVVLRNPEQSSRPRQPLCIFDKWRLAMIKQISPLLFFISLLLCSLGIIGCAQHPSSKPQTQSNIFFGYLFVESMRLDSICLAFVGDSLSHKFKVTDPRITYSDCYFTLAFPPWYWDSGGLGLFGFEVTVPCTVSIVMTDSIGMPRMWRHYVHLPERWVTSVAAIFPEAERDIYRFNVLVGSKSVCSCPYGFR